VELLPGGVIDSFPGNARTDNACWRKERTYNRLIDWFPGNALIDWFPGNAPTYNPLIDWQLNWWAGWRYFLSLIIVFLNQWADWLISWKVINLIDLIVSLISGQDGGVSSFINHTVWCRSDVHDCSNDVCQTCFKTYRRHGLPFNSKDLQTIL
jgi:hypothetical protein